MSSLLHDAGPHGPPRVNGELVFSAPWEASAFAMAIALEEEGVVTYEEFRDRLIGSIAAWEALPARTREGWSYYERWLVALQAVLLDRGIIGDAELDARMAELARHDHHHA